MVWSSDTTGNAPRPGVGRAAAQRVDLRTNAPRKTTATETEAGGSGHGAGTAAGPGPETGNEPGGCRTQAVLFFFPHFSSEEISDHMLLAQQLLQHIISLTQVAFCFCHDLVLHSCVTP